MKPLTAAMAIIGGVLLFEAFGRAHRELRNQQLAIAMLADAVPLTPNAAEPTPTA